MQMGGSEPCSKNELDLFTIPPTQTVIEEGFFDDIPAHNSFKTSNVIRFDIEGDTRHYLNLSETELHVKGRLCDISNPDNFVELKATDATGPINNFFHSLFSQIEIDINNKSVENTNTTYAFRAYIRNLLGYNESQKKSALYGECFSKDGPGSFNSLELKTNEAHNSGFLTRRARFIGKSSVELQGKLDCDLFYLNHLIVNSVSFQIKITKNNSNFYLMGNNSGKFAFVFDEVFLRIKRQVISPSVMAALTKVSEQTPFKYPLKRTILKPFVIPFASNKFSLTICKGIMPRRALFFFIKTTAFDGSINENPFYFENFGVNSLNLKINSKSLPNTNGIILDYPHDNYLEGYKSLVKLIPDLDISYSEFKNGYAIYAFDLNPDVASSEHYSLLRDGVMELDVKLSEKQNNSITLMAFLEYDNVIEINKYRQLSFDYLV